MPAAPLVDASSTRIRADIRLAESFAAGKPIREYAPKSRGAEDFQALLNEVAAHFP
jgi:chromosome partitioning protein